MGIETEKQKIDRAKDKAGDDEPLELFPKESKETLSPAKFETLITKDIATHKGNGLDAESADEMAQPPIGSIGRHSIGRHPASGEDTQRVIDHQKEDNQRPNDRNLIEKLLFHPAKVRKKNNNEGI